MRMVAAGLSPQYIAKQLNLKTIYVERHINNINNKLKGENSGKLLNEAFEQGYLIIKK